MSTYDEFIKARGQIRNVVAEDLHCSICKGFGYVNLDDDVKVDPKWKGEEIKGQHYSFCICLACDGRAIAPIPMCELGL